jgi:glycerol-3-phosphate dehydrogenase (NAD+)
VELCGALKNIVALGAGFCDGLGFGTNTKAAMMRIGLSEMVKCCRCFYSADVRAETFFESCGVADLITTCFGGRNRKCAEAFAKTRSSWEDLEKEMLGGQKLQGTLTAIETFQVLSRKGQLHNFPFFHMVYRIVRSELPPEDLVKLQVSGQESVA